MAIGAILSAAKKIGSKAASAAKKQGKAFVSTKGGGDDEMVTAGLSAFKDRGTSAAKDFVGGNPLHYQTHVEKSTGANKRTSKTTLHHKGK